MSRINWNGTLHDTWPADLSLVQRALNYGDGLFETLRVFDGRLAFLEAHLARLFHGLQVLGCSIPTHWNYDFFEAAILQVATPNARVRLSVWRMPGGLYLPTSDVVQFFISSSPLDDNQFRWSDSGGIRIGLCTNVRLPLDTLSNLKAPNALRYVAAAQAAQAEGWDDALLLNSREQVCEATSSNVFWWVGDRLFTPPLSEGCVAGVLRAFLLTKYKVQEQAITFTDLHNTAHEVFLTNTIRGIIPVRELAGKALCQNRTQALFQSVFGQNI